MDDKERAKQILKYSDRITAVLKRRFPGGIPPKRFDVAFTPPQVTIEQPPPVVLATVPRRTFAIGNRKLSPSPDGPLPRLFFTSQSPLELEFASPQTCLPGL